MAEKKEVAASQEKPAEKPAEAKGARIRWNTSNLKSSYANVCNATSTREEVVLNFGINHGWERSQEEVEILLTDRIILSPYAAKRLVDVLNRLMSEYETRYGPLKADAAK